MEDYQLDILKKWISVKRNKGNWSWQQVAEANKTDEKTLQAFLDNQKEDNDWPELSVPQWKAFVKSQEEEENSKLQVIDQRGVTFLYSGDEDNSITIPTREDSAWQCYRQKLKDYGFRQDTIDIMEEGTLRILRKLNKDTRELGPVKGMVVGNVQSGKTANMAALMAMAADYGWNMFIVLSGTIENLRLQTQKRLTKDLYSDTCALSWKVIEKPKAIEQYGCRAMDYRWKSDCPDRHFTVCLKNSKILRHLIGWLRRYPDSMSQMRVLVIDDEADQAGINTNQEQNERTAINRLLMDLVNNTNFDPEVTVAKVKFQAMNYIGYTATPYANVLNECSEESLYPRNFIASLPVSDEYFGPQQIYGNNDLNYDGLDIIRDITDEDIVECEDIHNGDSTILPKSLTDAMCWFICGVACMRYWGHKKPISMLIHTSRNTEHHHNVVSAIQEWFKNHSNDYIINRCKDLWQEESQRFSKEKFLEQYHNYSDGNKSVRDSIKSYPLFNEIESELRRLLNIGVSNILMNEEEKIHRYTSGIHLCEDNCANKGTENGIVMRLIYPEEENMPTTAPAFIVVGGNTLSRGLTLEGLISTYFLRRTQTADTLMQMCRWFGYRRGYELIPRIWLQERVRDQFEYISNMDQSLREEIKQMAISGKRPQDYAVRLNNSPAANFIRIVAQNKMQEAIPATFDFSGHSTETVTFDNDAKLLRQNLEKTSVFIDSLGSPADFEINNPYNKCWLDVPYAQIQDFIQEFHFSARARVFNDLKPLLEWIEKQTEEGHLGNWSVVLAGKKDSADAKKWTSDGGVSITMVNRSQKSSNRPDKTINIGTLKSPTDSYSDINLSQISNELKAEIRSNDNHKISDINRIRAKAGKEDIPLLIIYVIDKDSQTRSEEQKSRQPLHAAEHVVALSINIPGQTIRSNRVSQIQIDLSEINRNNEG